jgi:hypothetical protein
MSASIPVRAVGVAVALALCTGTGAANAAPGAPDPRSAAGTFYGDPSAAARFWRYQDYEDDCVEMAVADVVGELTGSQPSEHAIVKLAQSTPSTVHHGPIYTKPGKHGPDAGTSFDDEPALLDHYRIHAVSTDNVNAARTGIPTGMTALERDLADGRKVIVGVNSELIWREPVEEKTPDGQPQANHAVVVTGIDVAAGIVHLNDSGDEHGRDEQVPIDTFIRSWDSSDDQMTVTGVS